MVLFFVWMLLQQKPSAAALFAIRCEEKYYQLEEMEGKQPPRIQAFHLVAMFGVLLSYFVFSHRCFLKTKIRVPQSSFSERIELLVSAGKWTIMMATKKRHKIVAQKQEMGHSPGKPPSISNSRHSIFVVIYVTKIVFFVRIWRYGRSAVDLGSRHMASGTGQQ